MDDFKKKAYKYVEEGEKKLKGSVWKNLFSSKSERRDNGLQCYEQAIKYFQLSKECSLIRGSSFRNLFSMCQTK